MATNLELVISASLLQTQTSPKEVNKTHHVVEGATTIGFLSADVTTNKGIWGLASCEFQVAETEVEHFQDAVAVDRFYWLLFAHKKRASRAPMDHDTPRKMKLFMQIRDMKNGCASYLFVSLGYGMSCDTPSQTS